MKILTDENVASFVVRELRKIGIDVKDVKEQKLFGASDQEILRHAHTEKRILVTHDKDFIHLTSSKKGDHKGVILLRLLDQCPSNVAEVLLRFLASDMDKNLSNSVVVVSEFKITVHREF